MHLHKFWGKVVVKEKRGRKRYVLFTHPKKLTKKEAYNFFDGILSKEDTILYTSCFDANGGLFETLLDENDAISQLYADDKPSPSDLKRIRKV